MSWREEIQKEESIPSFEPVLVERGSQLAAVGNCVSCHTVPGEKAFAGGLPLETPFGTIHSTNISPDPASGIGSWSEAAFQRAMNEGVDREGHHLYPAFPYDHFTWVTPEDNKALYAYLMTRPAVEAQPKVNSLSFPFNLRPLIAAWKFLYLSPGPYQPIANQTAEWNRGAYLTEGLGHCGSCHTPRNSLGAEDNKRKFDGGEAEGWQAYAINRRSPAPIPWDKDKLAFYLRNGFHELHGISRGPMAEVTANLAQLPDSDIAAIAEYVLSHMGEPKPEKLAQAANVKQSSSRIHQGSARQDQMASLVPLSAKPKSGEIVYRAVCASCHEGNSTPPFGGLNFHLSTAVNAPNPQNIVNVTLFGLPPADGEVSSIMPAFHAVLTDQEMVDLLNYMRSEFSKQPPWPEVLKLVQDTRSGAHKVAIRPADGIERGPSNVLAKE